MSLSYTYENNIFITDNINAVTPVAQKTIKNKTYYYFIIICDGVTHISKNYTTEAEAISDRTAIISKI